MTLDTGEPYTRKLLAIGGTLRTVRKAKQQHVVEHGERDKALKMLRSATASEPNTSRLDLCLASEQSWVRLTLRASSSL